MRTMNLYRMNATSVGLPLHSYSVFSWSEGAAKRLVTYAYACEHGIDGKHVDAGLDPSHPIMANVSIAQVGGIIVERILTPAEAGSYLESSAAGG